MNSRVATEKAITTSEKPIVSSALIVKSSPRPAPGRGGDLVDVGGGAWSPSSAGNPAPGPVRTPMAGRDGREVPCGAGPARAPVALTGAAGTPQAAS